MVRKPHPIAKVSIEWKLHPTRIRTGTPVSPESYRRANVVGSVPSFSGVGLARPAPTSGSGGSVFAFETVTTRPNDRWAAQPAPQKREPRSRTQREPQFPIHSLVASPKISQIRPIHS